MAEFVQQNIEETIPELEQLKQVGLFTAEEIKGIIKKRSHHEYRIVRRQKEKEDFLKYIQYEINFLQLIKKRRNRLNYFFKKEEIEEVIINRVLRLFRRGCTQNSEDIRLWLSYIEFAKKWEMTQELGRIYTRILKVHSGNPAIWIMAAKYQIENNQSSDTARSLMLRAIRHHPKSHKLWIEYFRLELMNTDKQRKRYAVLKRSQLDDKEDMNDSVMEGQVARMVYRQAILQMPDNIDFHLAFLSICEQFDFTMHILDEIYSDLEEKHGDKELAWNAISRRHLTQNSDSESIDVSEESRCQEIFEMAVASLPTVKMWSMYIDFCLERLERTGSVTTCNQRIKKTLDVLGRAHMAYEALPEKIFLKWLTILVNVSHIEDAMIIAKQAIAIHNTSVSLWCKYLQIVINYQDTDDEQHKSKVRKLIDEAVIKVKTKNSVPLWNIIVEWCLANDTDSLETLFQTGIREHHHISLTLKEHYLDWAYLQGGLKTARKVYAMLAKEKPLSVEFYQKYIAIENAQTEPKMKQIRSCYEDALSEFGTSKPDLWLDYIKMELTHPTGSPSNSPSLHWRAMQALEGDHVEIFTINYTLMQTGH